MSDRSLPSETPPLDEVHPKTERLPAPTAHGASPPGVSDLPDARRFGKYSRVERPCRGGMGEVWKAWDGELSRCVAAPPGFPNREPVEEELKQLERPS
jgi:hypothetical protein